MAKNVGRAVYIRASDVGRAFVDARYKTVAALNAKTIAVNNESIDATTPDENDPGGECWMESVAGGTSVTISCLLYTSPSPRDRTRSRMPSSA